MKRYLFFPFFSFFIAGELLAQSILGIDISHYQGNPNWTQVAAAGKVFAWTKATEGVSYTDPTYASNMSNGDAAGVVMGAYHFARPITNSAINEANYFLSVAGSLIGPGHLPPALDLEDPPSGSGLISSMTSAALTSWVQTWMTTVQNATGITPVIYTSSSIAAYVNSSLNVYKLWIAKPDGSATTPPTGLGVWNPNWAFKQYSWTGTVSGINATDVDLDVFNGTMNDFNALIGTSVTSSSPTLCHNDTVCTPMTLTINTSNTCTPTGCSTINATAESTAISFTGGNSCTSTYQSGRYDDDVWFSITPSSNLPVTVRVVPTSNTANFDPVIGLYTNNCASPAQLACKDSFGVGVAESLYYTPSAGTTYLIRIFGYGIGSQYAGNFDICVYSTCSPPIKPVITGTNPICSGQSVTLTVSNPCSGCTYSWSNGESGNSITVSSAATYRVTATNTCSIAVSDPYTLTVNPVFTPSVFISANTGTTICTGQSVTFTASPTNGGNTPTYQWKLNGNSVAIGANYISNTLSNADIVTCEMVSSLTSCITSTNAVSNTLVMNVNSTVVPSLWFSPASLNVCAGTTVTLTPSFSGGGASPAFQWKKNGVDIIGANDSTYTVLNVANTDTFKCEFTSSAACANPVTVLSTPCIVHVSQPVSPVITINLPSGNYVCVGTAVDFSSTAINAGNSPVYQWKINGVDVIGANSANYFTDSLSNGDVVTCGLTSNESCVSPATVNSNAITANVDSIVTPAVSILSNQGNTICSGTNVIFAATPINGGNSPAYEWKINGNSVATGDTFSTSLLNNGDEVVCEMTSSFLCVSDNGFASSNSIQMAVSTTPSPTVQLNNCDMAATFIPNALYQWYVNGSLIPSATSRFYTASQSGYFYVVADLNSCIAQSADVFVNYPACLPAGMEENSSDFDFQMHNMGKNDWKFITEPSCRSLEIFDALGQIILKENLQSRESIINLNRFLAGVYFVKISNHKNSYAVKKIFLSQ